MGRRSSSPLMNLFQTMNDDVKDFVDDEVDRTRDSERDLRRAGRRWSDDHDNEPRGRSPRSTDDDLVRASERSRARAQEGEPPGADALPPRDAKAHDTAEHLDSRVSLLLTEAYRHSKAIGAWGDAATVLDAAGLSTTAPGVVVNDNPSSALSHLVDLIGAHRVWERFTPTRV